MPLASMIVGLAKRTFHRIVLPQALFGLCALLFTACVVIPDHAKPLNHAQRDPQALQIVDTKKPLNAATAVRKINALASDESIQAALAHHLLIEQSIVGQPLFADNPVTLLFNGESTFAQMRRLLSAANHSIHLEYFIFENVNLSGVILKALLLEKLAQGVTVRLIYDAVGSDHTPPALFAALEQAGMQTVVFHPTQGSTLTELNQRDHRKIMVVDGQVAIVGGVNLSKTYQSEGSFRLFKKDLQEPLLVSRWRDTDAMISDPVVTEI